MNSTLAENIQTILDINIREPKRFNALLNLKLNRCDYEAKTVSFRFDAEEEWCLNPYEGVHGGVICSMVDTSMGIGAAALTEKFPTTTDLSVNFLKPFLGKHYDIDVEYTHIGNKIIRAIAKVHDIDSGILCATAIAGYMAINKNIKETFK